MTRDEKIVLMIRCARSAKVRRDFTRIAKYVAKAAYLMHTDSCSLDASLADRYSKMIRDVAASY